MQKSSVSTSRYLPFVICLLASLFYLYEFILQVSPSVMTKELMHDFSIGAAGIGVISAFYFYAYTSMQIPAGLLYDHFGPRRVLTVAILFCSAGAFFFCSTTSVSLAAAGRFLMGIGSAFSFIGALMLVARWFPPQYFALIAGIVQLMSSVGAITGQIPIAATVNIFGWRHTIFFVAFAGLLLAIIVWCVVRDRPPGSHHISIENKPHKGELKRLWALLKKSQTWFVGIYAFASWGPVVVFASLWGIPYLAERYNISITAASTACSMIWLGIGIGSPLFGFWSDFIQKRCLPLVICALLALFSAIFILYVPAVSFKWMYVLLFIFGLAASGQSLSFAIVKDNTPDNFIGTAVGFNNMIVVLSGAIFQPLSGIILHHYWHKTLFGGVPFYSANDYVRAMMIIPVCGLLGVIIGAFFVKETHARKTYISDTEAIPAEKEKLGYCA